MSFCILRVAKLKKFKEIRGSAGHTFREIPTPNADPSRTHRNVTIGANGRDAVCKAIKDRLPEKRRDDAVLCVEYLITASPEYFHETPEKEQTKYFNNAIRWLYEKHGKENVVCLNLQRDETSPHLVAYVVPLTPDGRLSARDVLGGPQKMGEMQTDFAEKVGKPAGLQRGIEGSKAVHTRVSKFYTAIQKNPALAPPEPPEPTIADRITGKATKMEAEHQMKRAEFGALVEQARQVAILSGPSRKAQAQALEKQRRKTATLAAEKEKAEQEAAAAKARADRLARENKQLIEQAVRREQDFASEKSLLQETIDGLKSALQAARIKIDRLMAQVSLLKSWLFPKRDVENIDGNPDSGPIVRP